MIFCRTMRTAPTQNGFFCSLFITMSNSLTRDLFYFSFHCSCSKWKKGFDENWWLLSSILTDYLVTHPFIQSFVRPLTCCQLTHEEKGKSFLNFITYHSLAYFGSFHHKVWFWSSKCKYLVAKSSLSFWSGHKIEFCCNIINYLISFCYLVQRYK